MKENVTWILGFWVNLNLTKVGHYALDMLPTDDKERMTAEECLVALPEDPEERMATSDFGKVLTMDLKEVKGGPYRNIFHMIDGFTRYNASVFLTSKKPETIVDNMMTTWVANYGRRRGAGRTSEASPIMKTYDSWERQ